MVKPFLINLLGEYIAPLEGEKILFPALPKARDLFATFSVARKSRRTRAIS